MTHRFAAALLLAAALVVHGSRTASAAGPTDSEIKAEVHRELARVDRTAERLTVEVRNGVVMLSGEAGTLWVKQEAIRRALKVKGVQSLEAQVTIPRAENDAALIKAVGDRIRTYSLYGVYDTIDGRVSNGAVRLEGAVTEPKKFDDLAERVAKVKGVQSLDNRIVVLPTSKSDDQLRVVIANAIYSDQAFENYSMVDPPVHVIVNNGHVTLVGFVRSQIEFIKAESIARSVHGVLALENKVVVTGPK